MVREAGGVALTQSHPVSLLEIGRKTWWPFACCNPSAGALTAVTRDEPEYALNAVSAALTSSSPVNMAAFVALSAVNFQSCSYLTEVGAMPVPLIVLLWTLPCDLLRSEAAVYYVRCVRPSIHSILEAWVLKPGMAAVIE